MILRDLEIVNIRSHREARIVFSRGITLFEGDIGSGKSSILMAIEFALFGLGSQRPDALLSQGKPSGSVRLRFEVDGVQYDIKRQLKRSAGRIGQDKKESYLMCGTVIENLAPSELKERVLGILGFNEPKGPRAASRIFRYAVYTPQGEMKRVLSDAKERLATVRRAFDMESYDTARDNAKHLKDHIDMEAARLEGRFADMAEAEGRAAEARREIGSAAGLLAGAEKARDAAAAEEGNVKERLAGLRARAAEREVLRERMSGLESQAAEAKRRGASLREQARAAEAELAEIEGRIEGFREPPRPTDRADAEISAEIDALRAVRSSMDAAEARAAVLRRQIAEAGGEMSGIDPDAGDKAAAGKRREAARAAAAAEGARAAAAASEDKVRAERDGLRARAAEREVLRERMSGLESQAAEAKRRGASLREQARAAEAELAEIEGRIEGFREPPRPTDRADAEISAEIDALRAVRSSMDAAEARAAVLRGQLAEADAGMPGAGAEDPCAAAAEAAENKRRIEADMSAARGRTEELMRDSSRVSTSLMRVKTEMGQARKDLDRIAKLGSRCHTCETELTPGHLAGIRGEREAVIERCSGEAERLDAEQGRLDADLADLGSRTARLEADMRAAAEAEQAAAEARRVRERLAAERDSKSAELERTLSEAGELRGRYAADRAADRFECDEDDPVGYLLRLREALAAHADALARLAELRERAGLARRDMGARRKEAEAAEADARRAEDGMAEAGRGLAAFGGLDAELDALASRQAEIDAEGAAAAEAEQAAAEAEQAAAEAEQAAAEARRVRERLAAERDSKSAELERTLSEAGELRGRYAADRAADRFECDEDDPVGYLLRLREALAAHADALARLAELRERAGLARRDMGARRKEAEAAEADARRAEDGMAEAGRGLAAFGGLDAELAGAERGLAEAQARRRGAEADAAAHAESASGWRRRLDADLEALKRAGRSKIEHDTCVQFSRWIESYFVPSVARIERQVLVSLQSGFDEAYRGWFATLVDDETKTSRIDDTFMPVVDQDGYEIDSAHLSGGERTSVSLAYRLALNTLLRRETKSLRSNLLVLDEPTDGFSKSQLAKVHSILKDLDYEQIIIVSHDRELETHADHVFHVTKEGGSSTVREA